MNTNALKRFAKEARLKLLSQVARKLEFVLTQDTAELRGKTKELSQLRQKIRDLGQAQVIEMVAYTWFNRLVALRFMDANGYTLPKVLTPLPGMTNPEILQNALGGTLDPDLTLDRQRLNDLLDGRTAAADARTDAYKLLLVAACNQWSKAMPFMFERISDYTELLLPDDLLSDFGIVADIRNGMSDEDCQQEELLGWLYQFYISDENERLIKSKSIYQKHELAPASQLFTPKWIVKYLVDNTLGQVWAEMNPNTTILDKLEFYIEPSYKNQLSTRSKKRLEDIKFFEPCVGSAHILSYAFDVFYLMYEEQGYNSSEIPELILKHNLFGVDIDERAAQIASFVMMMKGRRKHSRFFRKQIEPNITFYQNFENDPKFNNVKALGSLVKVEPNEIDTLKVEGGSLFTERQEKLKKLYTFLGQRYDCVVTNPPYISSSRMEGSVKQYVEVNYPDTKADLFATFIVRCLELCNEEGLTGYMTPFVWMFISTYQKLRNNLIDNHLINNLIQLEYSGFDGATVPICTFTLRNKNIQDAKGSYVRLSDFKGSENQGPKTLEAIQNPHCGWFYTANQKDFEKIPGSPIGYWASPHLIKCFEEGGSIEDITVSRNGMTTGNNDRFLRKWFEISNKNLNVNINDISQKLDVGTKWVPYNKGGEYRKWFGNIVDVLFWFDHQNVLFKNKNTIVRNRNYYFKDGITWTLLSSSYFGVRSLEIGSVFDVNGMSMFTTNVHVDKYYLLGLLASKLSKKFLEIINPTLAFQVGDINKIPILTSLKSNNISKIVLKNIEISKKDWNLKESLSWDFQQNELIKQQKGAVSEALESYQSYWSEKFYELHGNEEELNRQFIEIYGLQEELTPEVPLEEITILQEEAKIVNGALSIEPVPVLLQLLSYTVGCLFGRYSLDKEGLILANQGETLQDFLQQIPNPTFLPDEDNIIPVLEGEWFNDDIVGRFRAFLKAAFGEEHFDQNLRFIEDTLGKDIRKYFVKDFYNDHIKRYKKRPIYWMFSSPKGHFKALMYLHRYQPDLCSKLLNDYLQAFISKLEAAKHTQTMLSVREDISAREKIAANKEIDKLELMLKDCRDYERTLFLIATQKINMDLDDGVKVNYQKFKEVLVPIKGLESDE
ncbi:BREX-1 system adenine-specific DNA-methyltransferase PglX [Runella slithyformis]|uniref:site-specific DNA-methyltransferase (adenine-specific) n=1 Tax=Runella slithyformis (strain ATCC 29530 / DSM 19594 / LMG 11500 / NCIMB 11436 / LSU 4) TaxID=761193 RepID=A0A7U3ZNT2_RUNSL|nr:BREX-1 system adenine-specific DNA-methyltransferase PglX [Runella slithyformis]AEI50611.1 hypothetical protein Runsl_4268 [Runella slithyformis DSM 19594]